MKKFILFFAVVVLLSANLYSQNNKIVVGYYGWPDKTNYPNTVIDFTNLTHICHTFLWPLSDGRIDLSNLDLDPGLITAAHNKSIKVLVSIGGYGTATQNSGFKGMVNNATSRTAFIQNLVDFILKNKYDGADFDWEYPSSADKANFTTLLTDLRTAFNTNNIPLITAAVPSSDYNGGYDIPKLKNILDWIGIMTYDFTGTWEQPGTKMYHNSALYGSGKQPYSIDKSVNIWAGYGMPKSKICAGMPFYGYLLNAPDIFGSITTTTGAKALSYNTIANSYLNNSGWEFNFDNTTKNPYLRNSAHTQVITFDDTASTRMKCEYINSKALAGTIIWKISQSYNSTNKQNPLLSTVGQFLLKNMVSVVEENNILPEKFSLASYPNPFNPVTTIQYTIPSQEISNLVRVKINVYDMLGRTVRILVDQEQSSGVHKIAFDAADLSSGIYLCRFEAGNNVKIQKLVLSK